MRSLVVVVGVAIVIVVSASPLPEMFKNDIVVYGNNWHYHTKSI